MGPIRFSEGEASLIGSALNDRDDGVQFLLEGSLSEMFLQEKHLREAGFKVGRRYVTPGLHTAKEFVRALESIWVHRVEGWWKYRDRLLGSGICTMEQFNDAQVVWCGR